MASGPVCEWLLFSRISSLDAVLVSVAVPPSPINGLDHQTDRKLVESHAAWGIDYHAV